MSQKNQDKNLAAKEDRINKNSNVRVFTDVESFKKKMELYPDFYSHL